MSFSGIYEKTVSQPQDPLLWIWNRIQYAENIRILWIRISITVQIIENFPKLMCNYGLGWEGAREQDAGDRTQAGLCLRTVSPR